jgi:hypothetical protein
VLITTFAVRSETKASFPVTLAVDLPSLARPGNRGCVGKLSCRALLTLKVLYATAAGPRMRYGFFLTRYSKESGPCHQPTQASLDRKPWFPGE